MDSGSGMRREHRSKLDQPNRLHEAGAVQPQTRTELHVWIRERLRLLPALESALLTAIDAVFTRQERLWQ